MKKILLWILVAGVLAIGIGTLIILWKVGLVFSGFFEDNATENQQAMTFIEEEYDIEVEIVEVNKTGFFGLPRYRMALEEQQDVIFRVEKETDGTYSDDYQAVLAVYNALKQAGKIMPQIEKLGFEKPLSGLLVQYDPKDAKTGKTVRWLSLETDSSYDTVEPSEIESIVNAVKLVTEQAVDVQVIRFYNRWDQSKVDIDLREIEDIQSDEEIEAYIRSQ